MGGGSGLPSNTWFLGPTRPKQDLNQVNHFSTFHGRYQRTYQQNKWGTWNVPTAALLANGARSMQLVELTDDTTDWVAGNSDGVRYNWRLINNHFPHHQLGLMYSVLCASNHHRPVLIFLTLASEVDSRLRCFLDLKKTHTTNITVLLKLTALIMALKKWSSGSPPKNCDRAKCSFCVTLTNLWVCIIFARIHNFQFLSSTSSTICCNKISQFLTVGASKHR